MIGAGYTAAATLLIPRMGAAALVCAVVSGQVAGSLLLDRFGVLHARQPVDPAHLPGALLVVIGALLVVEAWK